MAAENGETQAHEAENGQEQGEGAEHSCEQPGGECGDGGDGRDGQQRADVEVAQVIGSGHEIVQEFALARGPAAQRQAARGCVVEGEADLCQDAEGHAVREVALAVAEDGAADAAGTHGGDAKCQRVEGRHQGRGGDEPGRGAEQREPREECREAHEQHGQELGG